MAEGQIDTIREIGQATVNATASASLPSHLRESIIDHIGRRAALAEGINNADLAFFAFKAKVDNQSLFRPQEPRDRSAALAQLLATGQSTEVLQDFVQRHRDDEYARELLTCLVQEMGIRDKLPSNGPIIEFHRARVSNTNHPLAWLPLDILEVEKGMEAYLPRYNPHGSAWSTAGYSGGAPISTCSETSIIWNPISRSTGIAAPITSAFDNWVEESNGTIEVGIFEAERPFVGSDIRIADFASLQLDCLEGVKGIAEAIRTSSAREVSHCLFSAASNGGAYNHGRYGAYGRLYAFRSLAALVGLGPHATVQEIADAAERCEWWTFGPPLPWFYYVAWDCGIVVLREDRRTLAVMAATDTD